MNFLHGELPIVMLSDKYSTREVALMAINLFNDILIGGSILSVVPMKFLRAGCSEQKIKATAPSVAPVLFGSLRSDEGGVWNERRDEFVSEEEVLMISVISRCSPSKACPAIVMLPQIASSWRGDG